MHRDEHEQAVEEVSETVHGEHRLRAAEYRELRSELADVKALLERDRKERGG